MFSNRCIYPAPQHLHASQTLGPGAQCPKAHGSPSLRPTGRVAGGWNVKECGQLGFGVRDRRCGRWRETVVDLTNLTNQEWEWNSGSLPLADPCQIQVDGGLLQDCQARAVLNSASESLAWCGWKMGASEWLITGFQSSTLTYLHGQNWVQIGYLGKNWQSSFEWAVEQSIWQISMGSVGSVSASQISRIWPLGFFQRSLVLPTPIFKRLRRGTMFLRVGRPSIKHTPRQTTSYKTTNGGENC